MSIVALLLGRVALLNDFKKELAVFAENPEIDIQVAHKIQKKNPIMLLEKVQYELENGSIDGLKEALFSWAKKEGLSVGPIMQSLRIALVGDLSGPDLFAIIGILEKSVTLNRIAYAITYFKNLNNIS